MLCTQLPREPNTILDLEQGDDGGDGRRGREESLVAVGQGVVAGLVLVVFKSISIYTCILDVLLWEFINTVTPGQILLVIVAGY